MKTNKNVVIKKVCHSRKLLSGIYNALKNTRWGSPTKTLGDDANEYAGMTAYLMSGSYLTYKKEALNKGSFRDPLRSGFTLIELLVVVLIIGILAAVAVPQYQKAVEKSRATEALAILKSVYQAQKIFYLAHGEYAEHFDELDVDIPWTGNTQWFVANDAEAKSNTDWSVQLYTNNEAGNGAVFVGRIDGKYKGAGFLMYLGFPSMPKDTILCMERLTTGIVFEGDEGDYCQKLWGGSRIESPSQRIFSFPL